MHESPVFAMRQRFLFSFIITFVVIFALLPMAARSQDAGCFDKDVLYVKVNTIPPPVSATPASFACNGSYSYQWQVSTDDKYFKDIPGATGQDLNYTQPITVTLYFLRKATCGNITRYTNSVVVYPIWEACTDFGLSLSGTTGNALATIKAGTLTTTSNSVIGEFVIEWYRNVIDDSPEFVSGSAGATDAAVTVTHPFSGEPAEGGTWYPVIKYVYIDGIKYSRNRIVGARHSPDLLHCLDPVIVIVNNLSCSNGTTVYYQGIPYAHLVSYRNTVNSTTLATRSFSFDLDATNKFFAWRFVGFQIADNVKITYVSPSNGNTETVLEYWKVGSNAGSANISTSPKILNFPSMGKISSLAGFTYTEGDYLRIEITPNSSNSNTDWDFYCTCIASPTCDATTSAVRNITPGSVSMTYDQTNCRYEVQYAVTNPYSGGYSSDFWRYHERQNFVDGSVVGSDASTTIKLQMQNKTVGTYGFTSYYGLGSCTSMADSAQVSKNGNVLTMTFKDMVDYNAYKTYYNNALANANISNYSADPTSINYYKFWIIEVVLGNSCGDALTRYQIRSHFSNPINFDDGTKTITTTIAAITNGYVSSGCDFTSQTTADLVSSNNYYAGNNLNFSGTTKVRGGMQCAYVYSVAQIDTDKRFKLWHKVINADVCDLAGKGWNTPTNNPWQWELVYVNDKVVITNGSDPIHNFRLERWMDANGNELLSNPIIIYEIVNGTVTVNRGFPN